MQKKLTINNLKRIRGVSLDQNIQIINKTIKQLRWKSTRINSLLIIVYLIWSFFNLFSYREVVNIFDNKGILINVATYGRGDLKSPFNWIGNRKKKNN